MRERKKSEISQGMLAHGVDCLVTGIFFAQIAALWICSTGCILLLIGPLPNGSIAVGLAALSGCLAEAGNLLGAEKKRGLRRIGYLPLVGMIRLLQSVLAGLWILPVVYLCGRMIESGSLIPKREVCSDRFGILITPILVGGILCSMERAVWALPLLVVLLPCMMFFFRILRHREDGCLNGSILLIELAIPGIVGIIAWVASRRIVWSSALWMLAAGLRLILTPIVWIFGGLLYGVLWCLARLLSLIRGTNPEPVEMDLSGFSLVETEAMETITSGFPAWMVWTGRILGAVILILAVYLLVRYLSSGLQRDQVQNAAVRREPIIGTADPRDKKPSIFDRSPRAVVRRAYAGLCREYEKRGRKPADGMTTERVNRELVPAEHREDAEQLRKLYLRARYTERGNLTENEAKQAKKLAEHILNS